MAIRFKEGVDAYGNKGVVMEFGPEEADYMATERRKLAKQGKRLPPLREEPDEE